MARKAAVEGALFQASGEDDPPATDPAVEANGANGHDADIPDAPQPAFVPPPPLPRSLSARARMDSRIENEKDAILRRLPYLNEANVPREELYAHLQTARLLAKSVAQSSQLRRDKARLESALAQAHTPQYVAQAVPIRPVLWEKIKRRLFKKRTG